MVFFSSKEHRAAQLSPIKTAGIPGNHEHLYQRPPGSWNAMEKWERSRSQAAFLATLPVATAVGDSVPLCFSHLSSLISLYSRSFSTSQLLLTHHDHLLMSSSGCLRRPDSWILSRLFSIFLPIPSTPSVFHMRGYYSILLSVGEFSLQPLIGHL